MFVSLFNRNVRRQAHIKIGQSAFMQLPYFYYFYVVICGKSKNPASFYVQRTNLILS